MLWCLVFLIRAKCHDDSEELGRFAYELLAYTEFPCDSLEIPSCAWVLCASFLR